MKRPAHHLGRPEICGEEVNPVKEFATFVSKMNPLYLMLVTAAVLVVLGMILHQIKRLDPYKGQILVLCALLWVALVFTVITFSFHEGKGALATATKASTMPRLWAGLMVPVAVLILAPIWKGQVKPDEKFGNWKLPLIVLCLVVACVAAFKYIGYYISSGLMILGIMILLKQKNKAVLIGLPLAWIAFTYGVFAKLLFIPLPVGRIFEGLLG